MTLGPSPTTGSLNSDSVTNKKRLPSNAINFAISLPIELRLQLLDEGGELRIAWSKCSPAKFSAEDIASFLKNYLCLPVDQFTV